MSTGAADTLESSIVLHYLENSRSQRVLWLLEELGVPYTVKTYKRTPEGRPPQEYRNLHALGKAPVLQDGDLLLSESGFIVEYLISKYGKRTFGVTSEEEPQIWRDNLFWANYSEASLQPLIIRRYSNFKYQNTVPSFMRPVAKVLFSRLDALIIAPDLETHSKFIESRLEAVKSQGGFFAGGERPTSADFMMLFALETLLKAAPECAGPMTHEYVKRMESRPAYVKALEKGLPYAYLYTEPEKVFELPSEEHLSFVGPVGVN